MITQRILQAVEFALKAHGGQNRKYTGEPYVVHTIEVARIVESYGGTEDMVIAAVLHDTVEDTEATIQEIEEAFGKKVATIVMELTDVSQLDDGNRATRKAIDREHIAKASAEAQTIKVADLISNSQSILDHDQKFGAVYLAEKKLLLDVLTKADARLLSFAWQLYNSLSTKKGTQ